MMGDVNVTTSQNNVNVSVNTIGGGSGSGSKEVFRTVKFVGTGSAAQIDTVSSEQFRSGSMRVFINGILAEKDSKYSEDANRRYIQALAVIPSGQRWELQYVKD